MAGEPFGFDRPVNEYEYANIEWNETPFVFVIDILCAMDVLLCHVVSDNNNCTVQRILIFLLLLFFDIFEQRPTVRHESGQGYTHTRARTHAHTVHHQRYSLYNIYMKFKYLWAAIITWLIRSHTFQLTTVMYDRLKLWLNVLWQISWNDWIWTGVSHDEIVTNSMSCGVGMDAICVMCRHLSHHTIGS